MKEEISNFRQLVSDYVRSVESSLQYLQKYSDDMGKYREIRRGYLDTEESLYFKFHGTGCLFINNGLNVDFEMPYQEDAIIPLDRFFLVKYWESCSEKFGYRNSEEIISDFEKARGYDTFGDHPFRSHQLVYSFPKQFRIFTDEFYE